MNPEEDQPNIEEEPVGDEEAAAGYEPPTIVVLGSIDQLTARNGSNGEDRVEN